MIVSMIRSWFSWETVYSTGVHRYQENRVTGKRRIQLIGIGYGYQPIDKGWLDTGKWTPVPKLPKNVRSIIGT